MFGIFKALSMFPDGALLICDIAHRFYLFFEYLMLVRKTSVNIFQIYLMSRNWIKIQLFEISEQLPAMCSLNPWALPINFSRQFIN